MLIEGQEVCVLNHARYTQYGEIACQILFDHCPIMPTEYHRALLIRCSSSTNSRLALLEHLMLGDRILKKLFTSNTTLYRIVTYIQNEGKVLVNFNICYPQLIVTQGVINIVFVLCHRS